MKRFALATAIIMLTAAFASAEVIGEWDVGDRRLEHGLHAERHADGRRNAGRLRHPRHRRERPPRARQQPRRRTKRLL